MELGRQLQFHLVSQALLREQFGARKQKAETQVTARIHPDRWRAMCVHVRKGHFSEKDDLQ